MRMQPCWGQQCEPISVVSTTWERRTECAAEQSKIQVVEALQDTGRWPFSHSKFLDFDHTLGYPSRFLSGAIWTTGKCRGCSSVGRALEWHSRGQGFDSPHLHG